MGNHFRHFDAFIASTHVEEEKVRGLRELLAKYKALRSGPDGYLPYLEDESGIHFQVTEVNDDYTFASDGGSIEVQWVRSRVLDELIRENRVILNFRTSFSSNG